MPRLLLLHQPVDGGVARHVVDIFRGFDGNGWEVSVCGPAPPAASGLAPAPDLAAAHIPLEMGRAVSPRNDLQAARDLQRIIGRLRPDVVHAHSSKAGAIARLLSPFNRGIPVIYTPHGFAYGGYFEHRAERWAYRSFERALMPLGARVLAVCEAEARLARSIGAHDRVRTVHNGVSIPLQGPGDDRIRELHRHGPVICAVTQLRAGKGVETLLDALPAVRRACPSAQLAVVGDGPLRSALSDRAARLGVAGAVHFLGEHPDPIAAMRVSDVFVLPSWAESFPYVILEAMSVALPIVASDVGGVREAIAHEQSGLLVPPRDAIALGAALSHSCADRVRAREIGLAAHRRVGEAFTVERMIRGVAAVYNEVRAGA